MNHGVRTGVRVTVSKYQTLIVTKGCPYYIQRSNNTTNWDAQLWEIAFNLTPPNVKICPKVGKQELKKTSYINIQYRLLILETAIQPWR
jgi:hypothetical protein